MRAWVIEWKWAGEHAAVEEPFVTVLSARKGADQVRTFVEMYYAAHSYSRVEKLSMARYNNANPNPYPAEFIANWQGAIHCGHNPHLEAFMAENVRIETSEDGQERIVYERLKHPARPEGGA